MSAVTGLGCNQNNPLSFNSEDTNVNNTQGASRTDEGLTIIDSDKVEQVKTFLAKLLEGRLSSPTISIEDIDINEFIQQLETLNIEGFELLSNQAGLTTLIAGFLEMLTAVSNMSPEEYEANRDVIEDSFKQAENSFKEAENSLYNLISSSRYPSFAGFLKEMLAVAQEIRELASTARAAAVQAEVKNILFQAQNMVDAAEERFKAAMAEVEAQRAEAWGQIASGIASAGFAIGGAAFGRFAGMEAIGGIGRSLGSIGTGIASHISADRKEDAASHTKAADLLDAARKSMEAGQKLIQDSQKLAEDIADIAKQLRDMVLNLYRDFISNHYQIIQRANV